MKGIPSLLEIFEKRPGKGDPRTKPKGKKSEPGKNIPADDILTIPPPPADVRLAYGTDPNQFGDLRLSKTKGPFPVVMNIHGGFWRAKYDLGHGGHLCAALTARGLATWNLEYRRVG